MTRLMFNWDHQKLLGEILAIYDVSFHSENVKEIVVSTIRKQIISLVMIMMFMYWTISHDY